MKARLKIFWMTLLAFSMSITGSTVDVDIYQSMASGVDGDLLSSPIMNASSYGGSEEVTAVWSLDGGSLWVSDDITDDIIRSLPGTITVEGINHSGLGGHAWRVRNKYERNWVEVNFASNQWGYPYHERLTFACYFTPGQTETFNNQHDNITMGGNQGFGVLQTHGPGGELYIRAHSSSPGWVTTFSPTMVRVVPGKTYWINLHHDGPAGKCRVAVFDPDTWTHVEGSPVAADSVVGSSVRSLVRFGRRDGHGDNSSFTENNSTYFQHILIDFSEGKFPLLPDGVGPIFGDGFENSSTSAWSGTVE